MSLASAAPMTVTDVLPAGVTRDGVFASPILAAVKTVNVAGVAFELRCGTPERVKTCGLVDGEGVEQRRTTELRLDDRGGFVATFGADTASTAEPLVVQLVAAPAR